MREKIKNLEEFRALQEKFVQARSHEKRKVLVCCGTGCAAGGNLAVYEELKNQMQAHGADAAPAESRMTCGGLLLCRDLCQASRLDLARVPGWTRWRSPRLRPAACTGDRQACRQAAEAASACLRSVAMPAGRRQRSAERSPPSPASTRSGVHQQPCARSPGPVRLGGAAWQGQGPAGQMLSQGLLPARYLPASALRPLPVAGTHAILIGVPGHRVLSQSW